MSAKKLIKQISESLGFDIRRKLSVDADECLYSEQRKNNSIYVNIGAGGFYHRYWTNLDKDNDFYRKIQSQTLYKSYDITSLSPLPFEDSSVDIFYTSHTIEHINDKCAEFLFRDVFRCLKKNGVFRVTCPDMELQYNAYARSDPTFWPQPSPWHTYSNTIEERFLEHFATCLTPRNIKKFALETKFAFDPKEFHNLIATTEPSAFFNFICNFIPKDINSVFPEGHCNWFSHTKLTDMLQNAGYTDVQRSGFGQSLEPKLRRTDLFDSTCPEFSLYVEAYKK